MSDIRELLQTSWELGSLHAILCLFVIYQLSRRALSERLVQLGQTIRRRTPRKIEYTLTRSVCQLRANCPTTMHCQLVLTMYVFVSEPVQQNAKRSVKFRLGYTSTHTHKCVSHSGRKASTKKRNKESDGSLARLEVSWRQGTFVNKTWDGGAEFLGTKPISISSKFRWTSLVVFYLFIYFNFSINEIPNHIIFRSDSRSTAGYQVGNLTGVRRFTPATFRLIRGDIDSLSNAVSCFVLSLKLRKHHWHFYSVV